LSSYAILPIILTKKTAELFL